MSATLPGASVRLRTNWRAGPRVTMSACAAANPSSASARTVSTWLMSFFMAGSWIGDWQESEGVANGADDQGHGARARVDVAEGAFAQERGASPRGLDLRR